MKMLFVVVVVTPPMCWLVSINCLKVTKRQHSTFCLGSGDDRLLPIPSLSLPIRTTKDITGTQADRTRQPSTGRAYMVSIRYGTSSEHGRVGGEAPRIISALCRLRMDTDVNLPLCLNFDECPQRPMAMSAIGQGVSCLKQACSSQNSRSNGT